ncbi:restriction endonuclease subunit S [Sphingomonas panacisoli]|uniref:restriction endonuclease subunit S n=1 Tax=Sphingomonas panacisoli TaxID=1813879 RepID=UPI001648BCAE|nr:hypothetical protein [Sphingomonas panacisoli]
MFADLPELGSLVNSVNVRGYQVTTDQYRAEGAHPIVDQGKKLICGYCDAPTLPCRLPVTVFGDHTREVKFITFPFVVGADGTKVLEPAGDQNPRYLSALIEYAAGRISSLGYARHFKELREARVPYTPMIAEQARVAAVLEAWDDAVAVAERLVATRQDRFVWVQSAVLTGRVRLLGCAQAWAATPLSRVLHEHRTTSTGAESVFSVSVHRGLIDQVEHLGRSFAAASTEHYNLVRPGDIVYTKSPTGDFPLGIIKQSKVERAVIVSPLYGVFTPASRELGILLDAYFASPDATLRYLTPLVQKGAKNTIAVTNTQFLQGRVILPSDSAETAMLASLVETCLSEARTAESQITLLRRQKHGLMHKLLTGEWRIPAGGDSFAPGGPAADRLAETAE